MFSHSIGSKILEVNTDHVSVVISRTSYFALSEDISVNDREYAVEVRGDNINDIRICAEKVSLDDGFDGIKRIAAAPLFFEGNNYRMDIRSNDGSQISVRRDKRDISGCFDTIFDCKNELSGVINFEKNVGYSDIEIFTDGMCRLAVRAKVCPVSHGTEKELSEVDWSIQDVLVGSVRSQEQLRWCLDKNRYYVPAYQIPEGRQIIRYVAVYESGTGVRFYGEVMQSTLVKRKQIPFPMSRNNADELYYYFAVNGWDTLNVPITYCDEAVYRARYTNIFLLRNSVHTYELFDVTSEKHYRLLQKLKKAFNDTVAEKNNKEPLFSADDTHYVMLQDGYFNILDNTGHILNQFSVNYFSNHPGAVLRKIISMLNADT